MNFTIKTIGCKVNTYESNRIKDELTKLGFNYIDVEDKSSYKDLDFYIVNTCSVTSIADKKSRQMLHLAKKYNPNVKVIAVGCLVDSLTVGANRHVGDDVLSSPVGANHHVVDDILSSHVGASIASPHLDGVDYLLSNKEKNHLSDLILSLAKDKNENCCGNAVGASIASPHELNRIRAFIKIQDGCNQYCTYCIIPYLRGSIVSRSNDDIINEVKEKSKSGVKEIVLTGIHLSSFGLDRNNLQYENDGAIEFARESLLEIMRQVAEVDGIERIRLGSLEPRIIDDNFLISLVENSVVGADTIHPHVGADIIRPHVGASIASPESNDNKLAEKFCANFCLSLQSGCDKTLKRMNRHYTTADFENACDLIRKHLPNATITTDVIVGFPGETEEDFNESLAFVKRMRFYNPNIFPYSRRKGTKADEMEGQLTNQVKHDRVKIMIGECDIISKEIEAEYNKIEHEILVEEIVEENGIKYGIGYTKEYIKKKIEIKS